MQHTVLHLQCLLYKKYAQKLERSCFLLFIFVILTSQLWECICVYCTLYIILLFIFVTEKGTATTASQSSHPFGFASLSVKRAVFRRSHRGRSKLVVVCVALWLWYGSCSGNDDVIMLEKGKSLKRMLSRVHLENCCGSSNTVVTRRSSWSDQYIMYFFYVSFV